jgi:hypothetical protein
MDSTLFGFIRKLKTKARLGKFPEFWADYIELNVEDAGPRELLALVRQHDFEVLYGQLVGADTEMDNPAIRAWFRQLYDFLRNPADTRNDDAGT